ncbi:helix-turn-helix domain-containing protein [Mycolicibacterium sp. 120266]|uniref:PucR family transcriptional regulator n=1 Tax=Mycolicibacterium sp. 120266 TaxID=3090601 RepID=UPI00299D2848|nr:helix-turn-helix domain-containing protein [Mycolicibacterium sp. 120266]MDX1876180.1 helix-turn-helix domain-containing protein [Mycolicibacterium sp. 120266]
MLLRKAWACHKHVQDEIFGAFETHGAEIGPLEELRALGRTLFAFTEFVVHEMSVNYGDEQSRWQGRLAAARRRVFDAVVSGEHPPADAESVLRLDFSWCHLMAVVLPTGRGYATERDAALDQYVRDIADALGARTAFALEQPDGRCELVWSSPISFDSRFVEILRLVPKPDWLQLAVGCSGKGIDGFRDCHRTARLAARVAELSRSASVRAYQDSRLLALLVSDPVAAKTFAAEVLGTLAQDDPKLKDIRQTLRLYLGSGRSRIAAAEALHLSPNTVAYRVKRAEELLERPVGEQTLETLVALELLEELPRLAALT